MKKILMMVLCVVLAFGVMSGCAKKPEVQTEAQKIAQLKEVILSTTENSLIAEGGFKLTETYGKNKYITYGKKDGEKRVVKSVTVNEAGEEVSAKYRVEGFDIKEDAENVGEYKLDDYEGLEAPIIDDWIEALFAIEHEAKLTETATEKTLQLTSSDGGVNSFDVIDFKFTTDKKLKGLSVKIQNFSSKDEMVIETGAQTFETPAKILALSIDSKAVQSMVAIELATINAIKDVVLGNLNTKFTSTSGDESQSAYITNDYVLLGNALYTKDGGYKVYEEEVDGVKTKEVEFEYDSYTEFSYMKLMVATSFNSGTEQIIFPAKTEGAAELEYNVSGTTTTISRGEGNKIVLENGKIKQIDAEVVTEVGNNGETTTTTKKGSMLYEYGKGTTEFGSELKAFMATDAHKAALKAYNRLEKMNSYELKEAKGLKLVVTGATNSEIKYDFSGSMDKGIATEGSTSNYLYGNKAYEIVAGEVRDCSKGNFDMCLGLAEGISQIISYGATLNVTDTAIEILMHGKIIGRITVADNELISKYEMFENEVVGGTITYTYGAQTVEIPKAVTDYYTANNN